MRTEPRFAEKLIIDRFGNGKIDVDADEIHQFERSHGESICAHNAIDLLMRSNAIAKQPESFAVKISRHSIDNKSRRIFCKHWIFSELFDISLCAVHHIIRRIMAAHNLDKLHNMRRIEK